MNSIFQLLDFDVLARLGMTLIHCLWQIVLLATALKVLLVVTSSQQAKTRYGAAMACMLAALLIPVVTFFSYEPGSFAQKPTKQIVTKTTSVTPQTLDDVTVDDRLDGQLLLPVGEGTMPVRSPELRTDKQAATPPLQRFFARLNTAAIKFAPWLTLLWLCGVFLFSIRPLRGLLQIARLKSTGLSQVETALDLQIKKLANRLELRRPVSIAKSALVSVPTVVGFFKPLILLPASSLSGLSPRELEAILLHELAHLKRYDDLAVLFQSLVETLLFFHPAVWWFSSIASDERENCCDDLATTLTGSRASLASALLSLEDIKHSPSHALSATGGQVVKRIRRLAADDRTSKPGQSASGLIAIGLVFFMCAGLWSMTTGPASLNESETRNFPEQTRMKIEGKPIVAEVSPDGAKVLFVKGLGRNQEIFIANRDGTEAKRLTDSKGANYSPNWSPDGKKVVFCSARSGSDQIYQMDPDGKNLKQITSFPDGARNPAHSATGWLSYEKLHPREGKSHPGDLILTNDKEKIAVIQKVNISNYRWSTDGKSICIGTPNEVYFFDVASRKLTSIKTPEKDKRLYAHGLFDITWSPDNSKVAGRIRFLGGRAYTAGADKDDHYIFGDREVFVVGPKGSFEVIPDAELRKRKEAWIKSRFLQARPMNKKIKSAWQRIQAAREAKLDSPNPMNGPATADSIDELESVLGYAIPDQLRDTLLLHDGSGKWGLEIADDSQGLDLMSTEEIKQHWLDDRKQQAEYEAEGDVYPKKPEWIPIFIEPAEGELQVYLDTTDGSILEYNQPASNEVADFRYADYLSFLAVLEHHIRLDLWFEWGDGLDAKPYIPPLMLNTPGINQLIAADKQSVSIRFPDGKVVSLKGKEGNRVISSILDSFHPVKFTRTPGVQNPEYELNFTVGSESHRIAIKIGPKEFLSYSLDNVQFAGGNPEKFKELMNAIGRN